MKTKVVFALVICAIADIQCSSFGLLDTVTDYVGDKVNNVKTYIRGEGAKVERIFDNTISTVKEHVDFWSYRPLKEPNAMMVDPDKILSVPSTITRNGYRCETHTVLSQGYLMSVHRIARKKSSFTSAKTVLLQHGLFGSSADWILNGPKKALAYVLADAGHDVWMSNVRGNRYAKEHTFFKSDSKSFWDFSWHDVALHDIPAVIDHINKIKGNCSITYMGHSMGTTILFAMLTLRPEYNSILKAGFALAPVAFFTDLKSPLRLLAPLASKVAYIDMITGTHDFLPKNSLLGKMTSACKLDHIDSLCKDVVFYICGSDENQYNEALMPTFISNLGTGTSWKTGVHFAQEVLLGGDRFQQFDYGSKYNQRLYGIKKPPQYDLSKITLPIKLFWAENDLLSSETDVMLLYDKLPSSKQIYKVPDPKFNHMDYLWAIDAPTLLNEEIIASLDRVYSS